MYVFLITLFQHVWLIPSHIASSSKFYIYTTFPTNLQALSALLALRSRLPPDMTKEYGLRVEAPSKPYFDVMQFKPTFTDGPPKSERLLRYLEAKKALSASEWQGQEFVHAVKKGEERPRDEPSTGSFRRGEKQRLGEADYEVLAAESSKAILTDAIHQRMRASPDPLPPFDPATPSSSRTPLPTSYDRPPWPGTIAINDDEPYRSQSEDLQAAISRWTEVTNVTHSSSSTTSSSDPSYTRRTRSSNPTPAIPSKWRQTPRSLRSGSQAHQTPPAESSSTPQAGFERGDKNAERKVMGKLKDILNEDL